MSILKKNEKKEKKIKTSLTGAGQRKLLGAISSVSLILVIIIAILANILVTKADLSYDVTDNQMFTISKQSKKICKSVKQDITIYFLASKKNVDDSFIQIVNQYKKASKHISVKYKDLDEYPSFAEQYLGSSESATAGDILVVCGDKARLVSQDNFYNYTYDDSGNYTTEINLEPYVTAAINYVTSDSTPVIYTLTGHGELEFDSSFQASIEQDNYQFKELNLLTESSVPSKCNILIINAPTSDLSKTDYKKIKKYLKNGGKMFYVCTTDSTAAKLTYFDKLLKLYGVKVNDGIVVETDSSMYMQNYPTYILPTIESSDVTDVLITNSTYILTPITKGLTITGENTQALLSTSDGAYSKTNLKSQTVDKEKGDIDGPFSIATETTDANGDAQVIVLGCPSAIMSKIDTYVSGGNSDFVSNCINSLCQQEDKISIKAKTVSNETATYTTAATTLVSFAAVIGIPVIILLIGVVVVIARRRSK